MIKNSFIVGVDEVGRGPLAGPLYVCSLVIEKSKEKIFLSDVDDSKKLSREERERLYKQLCELKKKGELDFSVSSVSAKVIDRIGIRKSLNLAVKRSLDKICSPEDVLVLLDGSLYAPEVYRQKTIIKGDEKEKSISAASIVAKVSRDRYMDKLSKRIGEYDFENNKGYGTKKHISLIKEFGLSGQHRNTFCKSLV